MKTVRVPAIIDPLEWPRAPWPETEQGRPFQLTYLGNMHWRDCPLVMLQAVKQVLEAGHNVFFNIVGTSGRTGFGRRAGELVESDPVLKSRVKFWGRVSDEEVRQRLSDSDALLFARRSGHAAQAAFPTRLPEYLMTGRPVISSDVGDIAEYLEDGRQIILAAPNRADAMAEGIIRLLTLPDSGRALGAAGLARCEECFDYRPYVQRLSELIAGLVSRARMGDARCRV